MFLLVWVERSRIALGGEIAIQLILKKIIKD